MDAVYKLSFAQKIRKAEATRRFRQTHPDYDSAYRQRNREKLRREQANWRRRYRTLVLRHYSGCTVPFCACCGETQYAFLTLDHVQNDGADHRRSLGNQAQVIRWIVRNDFPPGFQVLCWNCNLGKHLNGGVCPHADKKPA